ncbi:Hsp20/alpha crystallin family protein [Halopiger xanaduensis]|uniref:Heat shock protein Hsp20 n=1 Tax=Halopiger xanaduensis (strain DSM 18323 / JCM 14033 / SH-6) TaxID=797210 RepID=F8DBS6_HALXS|nr:Hsp20/alpha crystallin family protein [Halopiger xanaduensis]AEH38643.1 heat shock protein Hsp20 [Halopiger xanaduensis SH-6]
MTLKDLGRSVGNALYRQVGRANGQVQRHRSLPVDVLENDEAYLVVFDAPGAEPEDVQVRYLSGSVKIHIERFREFREGYEMRFPGRGMELEGEAELPADALVNPDAGTATLTESGTVRIEIPKADSTGDATDEADDNTISTDHADSQSAADRSETGTETEEVTVDD